MSLPMSLFNYFRMRLFPIMIIPIISRKWFNNEYFLIFPFIGTDNFSQLSESLYIYNESLYYTEI